MQKRDLSGEVLLKFKRGGQRTSFRGLLRWIKVVEEGRPKEARRAASPGPILRGEVQCQSAGVHISDPVYSSFTQTLGKYWFSPMPLVSFGLSSLVSGVWHGHLRPERHLATLRYPSSRLRRFTLWCCVRKSREKYRREFVREEVREEVRAVVCLDCSYTAAIPWRRVYI